MQIVNTRTSFIDGLVTHYGRGAIKLYKTRSTHVITNKNRLLLRLCTKSKINYMRNTSSQSVQITPNKSVIPSFCSKENKYSAESKFASKDETD